MPVQVKSLPVLPQSPSPALARPRCPSKARRVRALRPRRHPQAPTTPNRPVATHPRLQAGTRTCTRTVATLARLRRSNTRRSGMKGRRNRPSTRIRGRQHRGCSTEGSTQEDDLDVFCGFFLWAGSHTDPAELDKACSCVVFPFPHDGSRV